MGTGFLIFYSDKNALYKMVIVAQFCEYLKSNQLHILKG